MEDPSEEDWETEEEYCCSCLLEEESKSKVGWLLDKGLRLGKKVVVTGFVISSAPVVLPPLVVISALGFAVSVPFGVAFASYTCTEKLMNKLLPLGPAMPGHTLDYITGFMGTSEHEKEELEEDMSVDMEQEEKEQLEDMKAGVEMRIELVKNETTGEGGEDISPEIADGEIEGKDENFIDEGYAEDVEMEQEEKEQLEDMKAAVEKRIELVKNETTGDVVEDISPEIVDGEIEGKDENFIDEGYGEDVGEYLEGEDKVGADGFGSNLEVREEAEEAPFMEESNDEIPPAIEEVVIQEEIMDDKPFAELRPVIAINEGNDESGEDFLRPKRSVNVEQVNKETESQENLNSDIGKKELEEETTGLLRKIRDEGRDEDTSEQREKLSGKVEEEKDKKDLCSIREMAELGDENENLDEIGPESGKDEPLVVKEACSILDHVLDEGRKNLNIQETVKEMKESDEERRDMFSDRSEGLTGAAPKASEDYSLRLDKIRGEVKNMDRDMGMGIYSNGNTDLKENRLGSVLITIKPANNQNVLVNGTLVTETIDIKLEDKESPAVLVEAVVQEPGVGNKVITEKSGSGRKRDDSGKYESAADNASERDVNLVDDRGNEETGEIIRDERLDQTGKSASKGRSDSGEVEIISKVDAAVSSTEVLYSKERIWEQINAMRAIVGYSVAPQVSFTDELKALYIFTGVEPPSSFESSSSLAEVNDKLRFLMSIVGVK